MKNFLLDMFYGIVIVSILVGIGVVCNLILHTVIQFPWLILVVISLAIVWWIGNLYRTGRF